MSCRLIACAPLASAADWYAVVFVTEINPPHFAQSVIHGLLSIPCMLTYIFSVLRKVTITDAFVCQYRGPVPTKKVELIGRDSDHVPPQLYVTVCVNVTARPVPLPL